MFDRLTLAPPSEDEMEDFHDYDDEENSDLDSKLDEYEEEEEEDEEEVAAMVPPLGAPPAMELRPSRQPSSALSVRGHEPAPLLRPPPSR